MNLRFSYFKPVIIEDEIRQANYNDYHFRSFFPTFNFNGRIRYNRTDHTLGIL